MMDIRELQERYEKESQNADVYQTNELIDLTIAFWDKIEAFMDSTGVVYEKSRLSESVYIQCVVEVDEDGEIADYRTVRVSMHANGQAYDKNYIEDNFQAMMERLEKIIKTEEGIYCESKSVT